MNSSCSLKIAALSVGVMVLTAATISSRIMLFALIVKLFLAVGLKPITADMSGQFASVVYGWVNSHGNAAGFLSSQIMGVLLKDSDISDPNAWVPIFAIPCK